MENFLEKMRFFPPPLGLTKRLFASIEAVHRGDHIRAREDREQAEDVGDDYLRNLPTDKVAELSSESPPVTASDQDEIFFQRFIAEELYHHLAFLSRSPPAKGGRPLSIREAVTHGMGNALGLPQEEPLLGELADEFSNWLGELGQFTTGWGNITLADGNRFYLEELRPPEEDSVIPPRRVFIPRLSGSRERAGVRRTRGAGKPG